MCEEPKTPGWDHIDDTSGMLLNNTVVEKARPEEIAVVRELCVWEVVDRPRGEVVLGTRWIDINKGDENKPFYRSRLVVQEWKRQADWSFLTATPPLEALRSLLICATIEELPNEVGQPVAWSELVVSMLFDVPRAHFLQRRPAKRTVFVELPAEACTDKSKVGLLLRSMYVCRDAGVNWEFAICKVMTEIGFVQGKTSSPCIYRYFERQLRVWVRGDDFVSLGYITNVKCFFQKLQEFWFVTNRGILGPSDYHDCVQSIRALGRIVEWTDEGISWEADPRHAELIRMSFGVTGRSVSTPGVKDRLDDIEGETPLEEEAADRYGANTMRAQYLSSGSPEIQVECRDLARELQQPSNLDEMGL